MPRSEKRIGCLWVKRSFCCLAARLGAYGGCVPRIELTTEVQAVPETVFDACLDVDMHTESMGTSAERAVGGVTTGR